MLQVCLSHLRIPVINLQIFKSRQHPYKNGIKNITLSDQLSIQQLSILTDVDQKELIRKINQFSKQLIEPILPFYNLSSQKETPTTRPLKVTIMGYVDHGKLLYQIENQNYQKVVLIQKPKEGIFQQDYQIILQLFKKQLTILFIIHDQYKCKNRKKYRFVVGTYTILKGQSRKIYGLSVTNGILNKKCKNIETFDQKLPIQNVLKKRQIALNQVKITDYQIISNVEVKVGDEFECYKN